jgi:hypothetical protein
MKHQDQSLERVLESAVVVSWADLMRGAQSGLIHLEYSFAASGALDCLRVWSSITRGYWLLACTYWLSASQFHDSGVHFDNGYQSAGLARTLAAVMQHQSAFTLPANFGRQGLIQISTPTEKDTAAAAASMSDAFNRSRSAFGEPARALSGSEQYL